MTITVHIIDEARHWETKSTAAVVGSDPDHLRDSVRNLVDQTVALWKQGPDAGYRERALTMK